MAQARKEVVQFVRDRLALAMALGLPVALMVLMSTALSLTPTGMPIAVRDYDNSPASRRLIEALDASLVFRVVAIPLQWPAEQVFEAGQARAVIVIPEHFGRDIERRRTTPVQALVD